MDFEVLTEIVDVEMIAKGQGIRELARLRRLYGAGNWRKLKGVARIRLAYGWQNYIGTRHTESVNAN